MNQTKGLFKSSEMTICDWQMKEEKMPGNEINREKNRWLFFSNHHHEVWHIVRQIKMYFLVCDKKSKMIEQKRMNVFRVECVDLYMLCRVELN